MEKQEKIIFEAEISISLMVTMHGTVMADILSYDYIKE